MMQGTEHIAPKTSGTAASGTAKSSVFFQPKLTVNQPDDLYEREADVMADRVMRMAVPAGGEPRGTESKPEERYVQREVESRGAVPQADSRFERYVAGLGGRGNPLLTEERRFFESRFNRDFSDVRIHTDNAAAQSAHSIHAQAYTSGTNVVFGAGQYQPNTEKGRHLMAHELTHVMQQQGHIARQAAPEEPMDFETRLNRVKAFLTNNRIDEAVALVPSLAMQMNAEQAIREGIPLAVRLARLARFEAAQAILREVESAWLLQYVLDPTLATRIPYPEIPIFGSPDNTPAALVETAEQLALSGDHEQARRFFASAYYLMQQLIIVRTERRDMEIADLQESIGIDAANNVLSGINRLLFNVQFTQHYDYMRRIVSFYPQRVRAAIASGDRTAESVNTQLQAALLGSIRRDFLLDGAASSSLVLETTIPDADAGNHPIIQGINAATEIITPLPGTPREDEVAQHPYYSIEMGKLLDTFTGQEDFLTDLMRHPEIVNAFGDVAAIDMNNTEHRIRIWSILYRVWGGSADAFGRVLDKVERYLKNYTLHTEYNIRDSGMPYFTSVMPTDMIGRAVRDCGVYAMMTAYEMYRMGVQHRLDLRFRIISSLDHVVLVMFETHQNQHFVLSNDTISGPFPGVRQEDIISSVATNFGIVSNSRYAITPAAGVDLGDTGMSRRRFETTAWQRYQDIQNWGLRMQESVGPDGEVEDQYERHYRELRSYGNGAERLFRLLNEIDRELAASGTSGQLDVINRRMEVLMDAAIFLTSLFDRLGRNADVVTPSRRVRTLIGQRQYIFTTGNEGQLHPLSRLGILLLRYQHMGGTLNTLQQALLTWLRSVPMFESDLNSFRP